MESTPIKSNTDAVALTLKTLLILAAIFFQVIIPHDVISSKCCFTSKCIEAACRTEDGIALGPLIYSA